MAEFPNKKEISLGDDIGDVVLKINGVAIEVHTNGSVQVHRGGNVKTVTPIANDSGEQALTGEHKVGDKMNDGTVFAGNSPDSNKPLYAMPADAPFHLAFNEAKNYASEMNSVRAYGHDDWYLPTKNELNVLFNKRAAIGGFDIRGSNPAGCYRSSTQYDANRTWGQRFSDGTQGLATDDVLSPVRFVR
jgi:Protein of unknown function (DUF1566)